MKYFPALLFVATFARASERLPDIQWSYGLEMACRSATLKNRLILLREVHCDCDETSCTLLGLARTPAFLNRPSIRESLDRYFILAVAHAPKERDVVGLHHPSFIPPEFRRNTSEIRTLLVTPTGHVIHRLDLCPHAADLEGELSFAQRIREECFTPTWAPTPGWEARLRGLHAQHALKPELWHPSLVKGKPRPGTPNTAEWSGYATLDFAWQLDLKTALETAKELDSLVLYFQVVGNLDKEGC